MIAGGALDKRITIERFTVTTDDYGGEVKAWATYCTAWANVTFGKGDERRQAAQEQASLTATFRVRANATTAAIATTDRIQFDGAAWDIASNVPYKREGRDITAIRPA